MAVLFLLFLRSASRMGIGFRRYGVFPTGTNSLRGRCNMAEETTISLDSGSESSSTEVGLESTEPDVSTKADAAEDAAQLKQQIEELKRRNEQYKRERQGWESQSRKNMEDKNSLVERLARIEGRLESQPGTPEKKTSIEFKKAMQKWLDGDETDIDQVEQVFNKMQSGGAQGALPLDAMREAIRTELVQLGTKANVQSIVGARHPDMANTQSDLYQAVFEQYDNYAADNSNQLLYPQDAKYEVPMTGPQGGSKVVDARLVDRLAAELRLHGGIQEGRQQEQRARSTGGVQTGNGRQTSSQGRSVEAINLLTDGERALLADPKIRKGWSDIPADPKAAAKFFYDKLEPAEKAKRLATYRQSMRSGV